MQQPSSSEEQYTNMLETPIPRLVTALAIPTTVSMLVTVIYNTADTYFVSQINKSASAAVGMVYTLMAVLQAVGYGLGMGAGSLISRSLGRRDDEAAERCASSAFFAALLLGALVGWGCLAGLSPILRLLRCSRTMLPHARAYARYILLAAPLSCASFVLNNVLRAEGESRLAMWGLSVGGVLNVALDPLFLFVLPLGTGGAALATAVSQCVSFCLLLSFYLRGKSIVRVRLRSVSRRLGDYVQILATGLPTIFRQGLGSLAAALLNRQAVRYGDAAVAAITIANKVYVFVRNLTLGIGQGFQPVAGYNYSAGKRRRVWQSFCFAALLGSAVCLAAAGGIAALARPIMCWFSPDAEVRRIGTQTLYYACAVMPFLALSTYVNQLYQSLGFKTAATFLASCRQGVFFVPAILLLPQLWGCVGVQLSQPAADFLTFVVSVPFLFAFYRKRIVGAAEGAAPK